MLGWNSPDFTFTFAILNMATETADKLQITGIVSLSAGTVRSLFYIISAHEIPDCYLNASNCINKTDALQYVNG